MKNKNFGFTLIELLVVIVIIGILATISTATFKSYFGKARDAERVSAIQNMALMVKVDGAAQWNNTKFIYANAAALANLFQVNDFRQPKGTNNICYLMAMAASTGAVGDNNQFAFVTWGESTSTAGAPGAAGILVDGTGAYTKALEVTGNIVSTDFSCTVGTFANVKTKAEAALIGAYAGFTPSYLALSADGAVVVPGGGGGDGRDVCHGKTQVACPTTVVSNGPPAVYCVWNAGAAPAACE